MLLQNLNHATLIKLLRNGTLKIYQGFPHGMPTAEAEHD